MQYFQPEYLPIKDAFTFRIPHFNDERGGFAKLFQASKLNNSAFKNFEIKESFYSFSKKGTIRGMHFQLAPHQHAKVVTCPKGKLLDVIVDLRKDSPTYGQFCSVVLSEEKGLAIYIPEGCAHGFQSLEEDSMTLYLVSSEHSPEHDTGILYNSFGLKWPLESQKISERDLSFPKLEDFKSPF